MRCQIEGNQRLIQKKTTPQKQIQCTPLLVRKIAESGKTYKYHVVKMKTVNAHYIFLSFLLMSTIFMADDFFFKMYYVIFHLLFNQSKSYKTLVLFSYMVSTEFKVVHYTVKQLLKSAENGFIMKGSMMHKKYVYKSYRRKESNVLWK